MAKLAELFDAEIPTKRSELLKSHTNLLNIALLCEENYMQASNKADALAETKQYATQSLASVAYQINTLATSMLQMLDLQGVQIADMEKSTNHLARHVSFHMEKISRREIGGLTTSKHCLHTHKIVAPGDREKPIKYKSVPIDFSSLDEVGHGLKVSDPAKDRKKRKESEISLPSPRVVPDSFPVFNPDARPPNSPVECDLYAAVRKNTTLTPQGSPKSVRQYRSTKSVPVGGQPSPPPPPPPSDLDMPPPPHPMPPPPDASHPPAMGAPSAAAPPPTPPPPLPGALVAGGRKTEPEDVKMMMPPPPPPEVLVLPQDKAVSSMPPPPPVDNYPANMGLGDDEMPPPPEFVASSEVDQSAPADYIEKVIAIYGYEKNLEDELSFQEDDILYVLQKNPNGWYEGVLNGVTGLFPGNYVQAVP